MSTTSGPFPRTVTVMRSEMESAMVAVKCQAMTATSNFVSFDLCINLMIQLERFACFRRHQIHASIWTNIGPKHSSQNALRVADREKSSQR